MRKIVFALIALVVAAGAWWYFSPYWTLRQIQSAARAGDAKKLSAYVDYPAVREDLKGDFRRMMLKEAASRKQNDGFAAIGSAFALAMVDPVIDAMVTPEGVEAAFANRDKGKLEGRGGKLPDAPADPVIERDGLDAFKVRGKDPSKGALVFARSGLGWKLVGFDMPDIPAQTDGPEGTNG